MTPPFNLTGTRYEDTLTFACLDGYELIDGFSQTATITCQRDKLWSKGAPCRSLYTI